MGLEAEIGLVCSLREPGETTRRSEPRRRAGTMRAALFVAYLSSNFYSPCAARLTMRKVILRVCPRYDRNERVRRHLRWEAPQRAVARWSCAARRNPTQREHAMRLTSVLVERTLSQFEAEAIPDNHPAVPQLR